MISEFLRNIWMENATIPLAEESKASSVKNQDNINFFCCENGLVDHEFFPQSRNIKHTL